MENINVNEIFINIINIEKNKEEDNNIWINSKYKDLVKLQCNNIGNVGEIFIKNICDNCNIDATIDGTKTKKIGGGIGDGIILNKTIEIKTSFRGSKNPTFQHELGEIPWNSDYMIFIDVIPECIYITIFKNFSEDIYKNNKKCEPYFPTKIITWRKNKGAFKLDTSIKINESNIINGYTIKIDDNIKLDDIKKFIISAIK